MIRRGEVDLQREALFEQCVVVKFGAVVERERLELAAVTANGARRRLRYRVLVARGQLLDDRVAGLAFYQREHAMTQVTAHHRVTFPMPDVLSPLNFSRPLTNGSLAGQPAPRIMSAVALAAELAHDPRMAPQVATRLLVPADAPVDRFVADAQRPPLLEHAGNLFGASFTAQQPRHLRHVGGAEGRAPTTAPSARGGVTVRLLGAILAVVMGRVAAQFARDRAAVPAEQASNLRWRLAAHPLCGNQVSFFLGELVIRHRCNPVPGRMRRQLVSPLPPSVQRVLHLLCESARPN